MSPGELRRKPKKDVSLLLHDQSRLSLAPGGVANRVPVEVIAPQVRGLSDEPFDLGPANPPVGDERVEMSHHFGFGQRVQVRWLAATEIDTPEPLPVEGRTAGGVPDQITPATFLQGHDLLVMAPTQDA